MCLLGDISNFDLDVMFSVSLLLGFCSLTFSSFAASENAAPLFNISICISHGKQIAKNVLKV